MVAEGAPSDRRPQNPILRPGLSSSNHLANCSVKTFVEGNQALAEFLDAMKLGYNDFLDKSRIKEQPSLVLASSVVLGNGITG
jgi:hypothetical protein